MNASQILSADLLDILFEGKNKDYGAYELRRGYDSRLRLAMTVSGLVLVLLITAFVLYRPAVDLTSATIFDSDPTLTDLDPAPPQPDLPKPPQPLKPPVVRTIAFTTPLIVQDARPEEAPPAIDQLENTRIGNITIDGNADDGIVAPPVDNANGVVAVPDRGTDDNPDKVFISVETESVYPGGSEAWRRFLGKTIRYPQEAVEIAAMGTVVVQFIVDRAGKVSEVEAISGPEQLRAEAVRVIRKSGQWMPAIQNGRQVSSFKKQPITFVLAEQ